MAKAATELPTRAPATWLWIDKIVFTRLRTLGSAGDGRQRYVYEHQMTTARPRRSCLYMPGANAKALEKAKTLAADVLILDLEDSVAPEAKELAREQVAAAVKAGGYGKREIIVRVNGLATPWGKDDIAAACAAGPDGVLAPKIESGAQVRELDAALTAAGLAKGATFWANIETPRAILNIADIAAALKGTRLTCFVMGLNDLAKETRALQRPGRAPDGPHSKLRSRWASWLRARKALSPSTACSTT